MQINPADIRVETYNTGTAWFPKFNGVCIIHTPTSTTAYSATGRSQHSNRALAFETLLAKLNADTDYNKQMELQF